MLKIALIHDDLVQWGGAERVLLALSEIFPDAPIYTSVINFDNPVIKQNFAGKIITSFMQKIPNWKTNYKTLLPLYPLAFEQFDFSGFDLVISQTTRFAKSIITKPETLHICYCHTPPRFLYNFSEEKTPFLLKPYFNFLRNYDYVSSKRVDLWVAGSFNAKQRIRDVYRRESKVIYPFVDLNRFNSEDTFNGRYLLVISRLNKYKRVDLVIKAANILNKSLKIVGVGPEESNLRQLAKPNVEFLGLVKEEILTKIIGGCEALVIAGEEDFGLTALEAQALGKPVIAFGKGGSLENIIHGITGYFFKEQNETSLIWALEQLEKKGYNKKKCKEQAERFSKNKFISNFETLINSLKK